MKSRIHIYVFGTVQGVFFRSNTEDQARILSLTGWVRNRDDGSVEIVAEGEKVQLDALLHWAKKGPPGAIVEKCEHLWEEYKGEFKGFRTTY